VFLFPFSGIPGSHNDFFLVDAFGPSSLLGEGFQHLIVQLYPTDCDMRHVGPLIFYVKMPASIVVYPQHCNSS
jgi:hypothetical protein